MNYALAQLASRFGCSNTEDFTNRFYWSVYPVKDQPHQVVCQVSAKDPMIVGVKEVSLKRHDIQVPFYGVSLDVHIKDIPSMRCSDIVKILNTRYGVDIRENEIIDDVVTLPSTTLTVHPLSPQWYGTITINIQE